ncbi:hypothetical protein CLV63_110176 [Murinocardiopsis flavida]|uniref:SAV-6107-like HEPN domain-containing protein n=1 Tax=Murinocardiopsis flavida TaxID=645275 RepID=A0A2P8DI30_9ACTN|nr:SAV_6107 family HEPN domain-containing protein [Murinocardiopsis flavida]PSK96877.1 hypothetical protein CLV63_110176 [Murinocardiopsis flavida]
MAQNPLFSPDEARTRPRRRVAPATWAALDSAHAHLAEAAAAATAPLRYSAAHVAALRATAALLTHRGAMPVRSARGRRPRTAWDLLSESSPEFAEWSAFFAAGAAKRSAAEAGLPGAVTPAEADDLLRDTRVFTALIESTIGEADTGSGQALSKAS